MKCAHSSFDHFFFDHRWKSVSIKIASTNLKVHVLNSCLTMFERGRINLHFFTEFLRPFCAENYRRFSFILTFIDISTECKHYRRESFCHLFLKRNEEKKQKFIWAWDFNLLLMARDNSRFTLFIISLCLHLALSTLSLLAKNKGFKR